MPTVLAIETSCDETAVAILRQTDDGHISVLANIVSSQTKLHTEYGGVVPQLAAREHIRNIVPVLDEALTASGLSQDDLDTIAVTEGPGLMPALLVGVNAAKTLSLVWNKPLIGIHHLEGHIYANLLRDDITLRFPLIALIVSGGHTELVLMKDHFQYEILGATQDDASGEAFDKVARLLGLPYPGGPVVAKYGDQFRESQGEAVLNPLQKKFPRPMLTADNFDFSFSGLKTAVLYSVQKETPETRNGETFIPSICYAFQEAVVDVLVAKTKRALALYSPQTFVIAGGVSANLRLRGQLEQMIKDNFPETTFLTPEFKYSLDNASMIGAAALVRLSLMDDPQKKSLTENTLLLEPNANLPLADL